MRMNFCHLFSFLEVLNLFFLTIYGLTCTVHVWRVLLGGLKVRNLKLMTARHFEIAPNARKFLSILPTRQMTGKNITFNGSKQAAILPRYLHHSKARTLSVSAAWKTKV